MKLHLDLNEDHLKLIRFIRLEEQDQTLVIDKQVMLSLQSHILDDVATILGLRDQVIPGTEDDVDGGAYPDEVQERMLSAYYYVSKNLSLIESLLHQRCMEGIQPGKYVAVDNVMLWTKED